MAKWVDFVASLSGTPPQSVPELGASIDSLGQALGLVVPQELREFLVEYGPLQDEYGTTLVWPTSEIEARNREHRTSLAFSELYMPFNHLLLFGDRGNGDLFAYPIQANGVIHNLDVFVWEHETDARSWFAGGFRPFLREALGGVA
jgi:hypothetical protein